MGGGIIYKTAGGGFQSGRGRESDGIGGFGWCRGDLYDTSLRFERLKLACMFDKEYSSISSVRCERSSTGC